MQQDLLKEYNRERKRVQAYVNKQLKVGYVFEKAIVPNRPKKITEGSIRRLKAITPDRVKAARRQIDLETGELKKVPKATVKRASKEISRTRERASKPRKTKADTDSKSNKSNRPKGVIKQLTKTQKVKAETPKTPKTEVLSRPQQDIIIWDNFKSRVLARGYTPGGAILARWCSLIERTYGAEKASEFIRKAYDSGVELKDWMFYNNDGTVDVINELNEFFPGTVKEIVDITDLIDWLEDWENYLDYVGD